MVPKKKTAPNIKKINHEFSIILNNKNKNHLEIQFATNKYFRDPMYLRVFSILILMMLVCIKIMLQTLMLYTNNGYNIIEMVLY